MVSKIYDNAAEGDNEYFYGVKVIKPDIRCQDKDIAIIVTKSYYDEIKEKFEKYDSNIEERLFMFDGYFNDDMRPNDFISNIDKIVNNYNNLADEKSKELYLALLKYRYIRDIKLIREFCEPRKNCYFDKAFLDNFRSGLYIDVGSYNADFVTSLATLRDISSSKFYIFEPNKICCENIANNLDANISYELFSIALCDIESEMEFQQTNTSTSHLLDPNYNAYQNYLDNKVDIVKTNTLDNIVKEKVTGIKVDIEGSEQAMIKGATEIIKRDKPIILLSIYHRSGDLWELQDYIANLGLSYKFYIRHYSLCYTKTILYCIPDSV